VLIESPLPGVWIIDPEPIRDERGLFARTYCRDEFQAKGLSMDVVQCSTSWNARKGTLRGMHYQADPHGESKIVRCTRGAIFDVTLDLRPASPTFRKWFGLELSEENRKGLYLPVGFAHGFQTLADGAEVFYQISRPYVPDAARGVRWDDPAFGIRWPLPVSCISERDGTFPVI
jgi:dTDP-4-dehydrorhamnose 3,5-epimerase